MGCIHKHRCAHIYRVGQTIFICGVYNTVFLAGKSPNIRSYTVYTVHINDSGQP